MSNQLKPSNEITPDFQDKRTQKVPGKITVFKFVTAMIACVAIMALCIWQAIVSFETNVMQGSFYIVLTALGLAGGIFIATNYIRNKKK